MLQSLLNFDLFTDSEFVHVEWNGDTSIWSPPDGCTAVPDEERQHPIESVPTSPDPLDELTAAQLQAIRDIINQ